MDTKFVANTDKKNKFTVESAILYAEWLCGAAVASNDAPVIVKTALVGNGAPIELKGKSSKGKTPGSIKGTVINNTFTGFIPIPEKADPEADVWFEVKLPKHGLKEESNRIPVEPVICLKKIGWDRKEARRGDIVRLTVEFDSGVREGADATVSILEFDQDGNHDPVTSIKTNVQNNKIEIDWQYEYHEDTDDIPTKDELSKYGQNYNPPEYFFTVTINGVIIGKKQESGLLEFKDHVELEYLDSAGKPMADVSYTLTFADGSTRKGKTDTNGKAVEKDIPPGKVSVEYSEEGGK